MTIESGYVGPAVAVMVTAGGREHEVRVVVVGWSVCPFEDTEEEQAEIAFDGCLTTWWPRHLIRKETTP